MTGTLPVTVVISRRVRPGCEGAFERLLERLAHEAEAFPGHQGVSILRPAPGLRPTYTIVVHFRSRREFDAWTGSDIRARLLAEAVPLTESDMDVQQVGGLEGWFQLPGSPVILAPPKYKIAAVTWIAIFPLLLGANALLVPAIAAVPPLLRLALVSGLIILVMTYIVMPSATAIARPWLYPRTPQASPRQT